MPTTASFTRSIPFDPIRPGDIDVFAYDFVDELGDLGVISGATWTCQISVNSTVPDPDAASRVLSTPIFDETKTSVKVGEMLDGAIYLLTATITTSDGRRLSFAADVLCALEPASAPQPTPGLASFDYDEWIFRFPQFQPVGVETAERWFQYATRLHKNDGSGPIKDVETQTDALYLLTAHLAQLGGIAGGAADGTPSWVVGRISSASQGPISVSTEGFGLKGSLAAWYSSTQFGAQYYVMMAKYRTFRWRPGPPNRAAGLLPQLRRGYPFLSRR